MHALGGQCYQEEYLHWRIYTKVPLHVVQWNQFRGNLASNLGVVESVNGFRKLSDFLVHAPPSPTMAGRLIAIGPKELQHQGDHATPLQQPQPMVYKM